MAHPQPISLRPRQHRQTRPRGKKTGGGAPRVSSCRRSSIVLINILSQVSGFHFSFVASSVSRSLSHRSLSLIHLDVACPSSRSCSHNTRGGLAHGRCPRRCAPPGWTAAAADRRAPRGQSTPREPPGRRHPHVALTPPHTPSRASEGTTGGGSAEATRRRWHTSRAAPQRPRHQGAVATEHAARACRGHALESSSRRRRHDPPGAARPARSRPPARSPRQPSSCRAPRRL